jgi:hypothetical protein
VQPPVQRSSGAVRQVTLVAFYGAKRRPLGKLLGTWQDRLGRCIRQLGARIAFRPYPLAQIHATILGLERATGAGLRNRNFQELRGRAEVMRLPELLALILESGLLPFDAQFGGFEDRDCPFLSRSARPYHRSFSIQDKTAVIIGWPVRAPDRGRDGLPTRAYPMILDELRRSGQRFNVLHRWHREPADIDNDLYLRLGLLEGELADVQRELIQDEMRRALSRASPSMVQLGVSDLAVVSYPADEETLPIARSQVVRLTDPRLRNGDFIAQLYA